MRVSTAVAALIGEALATSAESCGEATLPDYTSLLQNLRTQKHVASTLPPSGILTEATCLEAAIAEFGVKVTQKRSTLVVPPSQDHWETGWKNVPGGCSVKSDDDWAAHWSPENPAKPNVFYISVTPAPTTSDACLAAAEAEFGSKVIEKRAKLIEKDGGWDHVPAGCSVQTGGGDWAAHWNSNANPSNPRTAPMYTLVKSMSALVYAEPDQVTGLPLCLSVSETESTTAMLETCNASEPFQQLTLSRVDTTLLPQYLGLDSVMMVRGQKCLALNPEGHGCHMVTLQDCAANNFNQIWTYMDGTWNSESNHLSSSESSAGQKLYACPPQHMKFKAPILTLR